MCTKLDASIPFWGIVHHTNIGTYDDVTRTREFDWFSRATSTDCRLTLHEQSLLPWCVVRDAMDHAHAGLPPGMSWNSDDMTFVFDDVNALFSGMADVCIAVLNGGDSECSEWIRLRAEAIVACVKRMRCAVAVNDLSIDIERHL